MLISELSKRTGVSVHTLRYYENYGLFKGENNKTVKTNNYKQYDESLIEKIQLIKEAKEIGFTLSEIKDLLEDWFNHQLSEEKKIQALEAKIIEIDSKITQFKRVKKMLIEGIQDVKEGKC
ncbi:DNA-binding transcriptional regulator, MerR family [Algoriphagus ornithinivorans]|uniref:DNA-binding transcriptional regulator, MerR family n=1 Tax=Algoriphagus ornithinivorans TaxID=226506 RepID=A0A1I5I238_9BACT|nr:MerR family transcriptional regulator [Algoriphagus ornithinivorans]SFO54615.1 DNA-binding transcriptional regulator, MerR family [Algoriphagus ornithinivorans]